MIEIKVDGGLAPRLRRGLFLFVGALLAIWLAYAARDLWIPLCIAFLIAMILDPLVDRMERRGWSRMGSATLIFALFFVFMGGLLSVLVPAVVNQSTEIVSAVGQYLPSASEKQTTHSLHRLLNKIKAPKFVSNSLLSASDKISQGMSKVSAWVGGLAESVAANLLWIVLIPIVAFYVLKDFHLLYARALLLVPREHRSLTQRMINQVTDIFVQYLRGLMIVCGMNGLATALVLALFRVPNPIALGAISAVLYVVPYIGAITTIALIAGVAFLSTTPQMTLIIVGSMILLHSVIFDQIITPRIVGNHVGLHPLLSLIALLVGGSLLGILGMVLAVPLAATVQMILVTLFPKLAQPIEVPTGEQIHAKMNEIVEAANVVDDVSDMVDIHDTIVAAVDSAEECATPPTA